MTFRPVATQARLVGLGLVVVGLAASGGAFWLAASRGIGPRTVGWGALGLALAVATLQLAYWTYGQFNLRYDLSRDALVIRWAATRQVVPMAAITHVVKGRPYLKGLGGAQRLGFEVGHTAVPDDAGEPRPTLVYATVPPERQVLIMTNGLAYAISPADATAFAEDFVQRRRLGPRQALEERTFPAPWARLSLWRDRLALQLLGLAAVLTAFAFGWLAWHYPDLPAFVSLRFVHDAAAGGAAPGPGGPKGGAWRLPTVGLLALVANAAVAAAAHERGFAVAARLLLVGAALVELALGIVLWRAIAP